jgi:hypothetical protein
MFKLYRFILLVMVFWLLATIPASAQKKVDLGTLRQNTYTNDFFGLKIEFPFGWLVGDNGLEAQLMGFQKQGVKAKNAKDQAALNKAMNRLTPLLGGYKSLPGSVSENSNLKIVVEDLSSEPALKTSEAYLKRIIASLKAVNLPAGFTVSAIQNETIDGQSINYVETRYSTNLKRSYVMVKKGFAVLITIDSYNHPEFDALHQVLLEADLDYKR